MTRRPALCSAGVLLLLATAARSAPGDLPDPRAEYRRVEILVTPDFSVDCQKRRSVVTCRINQRPPQLARLMLAVGQTSMATFELVDVASGGTDIRFRLRRPDIVVQTKVLTGPPRWIVELGTALTIVGPIEDELPFRAYPMPTGTVKLSVPPTRVEPLRGDGEAVRQFNTCFDLWKSRRFEQALTACEKVDRDLPSRPSARAATLLIGEIWADCF